MQRAFITIALIVALPATAGEGDVRYDHGLRIQSQSSSLHLTTRLQGRALMESDEPLSAHLARIRFSGKGHLVHDNVKYKFQLALEKGQVRVKDLYTDLDLGSAKLRIGQSKEAWSRQQITSSSQLALIDRSITDTDFYAGRGFGVMLHNGLGKSKRVEWALNAHLDDQLLQRDKETGIGNWNNTQQHVLPVVGGRLGYSSEGMKGYNEADLQGGGLRAAVAISAKAHLSDIDDTQGAYTQLDFALKAHGANLLGAVYGGERLVNGKLKPCGSGAHVQGGFMLNNKLQLAGRTAFTEFEGVVNTEVGGGVNVLLDGYHLYWQTGAYHVTRAAGADQVGKTWTAQSQVQLIF
ncbi:MAG: hypothetical protein ACI9MC_003140 [Kiritimatiellia bacterium]|jgi:hypothetical protein